MDYLGRTYSAFQASGIQKCPNCKRVMTRPEENPACLVDLDKGHKLGTMLTCPSDECKTRMIFCTCLGCMPR